MLTACDTSQLNSALSPELSIMEQNGTHPVSPLAARQLAALPHLISTATLSEGAKLANIRRTTLCHWMNDPDESGGGITRARQVPQVRFCGRLLTGVFVTPTGVEVLADSHGTPSKDYRGPQQTRAAEMMVSAAALLVVPK